MTARARAVRLLVAGTLLLGVTAAAPLARAASPAPPGAIGVDVSHPQCADAFPSGAAFAIVGVNRGRAFVSNLCLGSQFAAADDLPYTAGVYVNTGNPGPVSSFYWSKAGTSDPALCLDDTTPSDAGCAYNYGWHAAEQSLGAAVSAGVGIGGRTWWLDVETANSWLGTGVANAADLQGALDFLRTHGVEEVGLYSTGFQWGQITGGYRAGTAASYRVAWAPHFTPMFAMEDGPLWIAGVETLAKAQPRCATSFTGAPTRLVQFIDNGVDNDLVCGTAAPDPVPATAAACEPGAPVPTGYTAVLGTADDDTLDGTERAEIFYGGAGGDELFGGDGDDILCGGTGRDILIGGDGNDLLVGGTGRDDLRGQDDRDTLEAGDSADRLSGGDGRDALAGGDGDDDLSGGTGDDDLRGQAGSDTLDGGPGHDACSPGAGRNPAPKRC